jgi:hypothetical protein
MKLNSWFGGCRPGVCISWLLLAGVAAVILVGGCGERDGRGAYASLFPGDEVAEDILSSGAIVEYEGETLYDYLNGGAELYFDYDIVSIATREYTLSDDSGIEVSIYDMGTSGNAFGIYSIFRYAGAERVEIGNEAIRTAATLDFWKGKYYCKILAFGGADTAEGVMDGLAGAIAGKISEGGSLPALLGLLPEEDRIPGSEKYFHGSLALNNIRYIAQENILGLGDGTEGVTASYGSAEAGYIGYVLSYARPEAAEAAFNAYRAHLEVKAQETSPNGAEVYILEDGRTEALALRDTYIIGVWDAIPEMHTGFIEGVLSRLAGRD